MNPRFLLASGLCVAAAVGALSVVRSLTAAPVTTVSAAQSAPAVALSTSSDDGKAVYSFDLFEPWDSAGHRVIAFYGASVTGSGLASLSNCRLTDVGAGSEPLSVVGEVYTCTANLNVASWAEVHTKADVTLTVSRNN
jgi:hypothetical protein